MRLGRPAGVAIASAIVAAAVVGGCVDLFHATDFPALCETDPHASGCPRVDGSMAFDSGARDADADTAATPDARDASETSTPEASTDFCAWDPPTARAHAEHACAWLGACAGPLGNNALGPCMVNALLAYDCRINPARKVQKQLYAYWKCLASATSCDAVALCVSPNKPQGCSNASTEYLACEGAPNAPDNANVRIDCTPGAKVWGTENCLAVGQTCAVRGATSACTGKGSADASCAGLGCDGTQLRDCTGGNGDNGVDCTLYGKGQCVGFDGGGAACAAVSVTACDAGGEVKCSDAGAAIGCPSGAQETIDCTALLGGDAGTCAPTVSGQTWDVARACIAAGPSCTEGCVGTVARGCTRGATFDVDCASANVGLKTCITETFENKVHAACKP